MKDDEFSGIYDDEGNRIDPATIPKTALCLSCKNDTPMREGGELNDLVDEELILCLLTRADLEEGEEFICYAYEQRESQ